MTIIVICFFPNNKDGYISPYLEVSASPLSLDTPTPWINERYCLVSTQCAIQHLESQIYWTHTQVWRSYGRRLVSRSVCPTYISKNASKDFFWFFAWIKRFVGVAKWRSAIFEKKFRFIQKLSTIEILVINCLNVEEKDTEHTQKIVGQNLWGTSSK